MENKSVNSETNEGRTAHSTIRKGLSDYHDGENVTDYLGNDDYENGANLPERKGDIKKLDGKVAGGNEYMEKDELSSPEDKKNDEQQDF